jgi:hypothetical protein
MPYDDLDYHQAGQIRPDNLKEWLQHQAPDVWHLATQSTDYDGDTDLLLWVVSNPRCELSTALTILWQGFPNQSLAYYSSTDFDMAASLINYSGRRLPRAPLGTFVLHREIISRLSRGFYKNRSIQFKTGYATEADSLPVSKRWHDDAMRKIDKAGLPRPWNLPDWAATPFGGREADSIYEFEHGYSIWWKMDYWDKHIRPGLASRN